MLTIIKNTCFLIVFSLSQLVCAADASSEIKQVPKTADQVPQEIGLNLNSGLDVLGGLFLVLALFMACAWLMKRTQGGFLNASKEMKTLGAMSLGAREKAVLVEVEGKKLLLGVSPGRVNTLHVFEAGDEVVESGDSITESEQPSVENTAQNKNDFASQLMQLIPKNTHNDPSTKNSTASK